MAIYHEMNDHLTEELLGYYSYDPYEKLYRIFTVLGFIAAAILFIVRIDDFFENLGLLVVYLMSGIFSIIWIPFGEICDVIFRAESFEFWGMFPRIISNFFVSMWEAIKLLWPYFWPIAAGYGLTLITMLLPLPGRIPPEYTGEDADKRIAELQAGIDGELIMKDILMRLPDTYDVFKNLYIFDGGKIDPNNFNESSFSETDFVVLGPSGVFVIETKNYGGTISGNASDERLKRIRGQGKNEHSDTVYNPVKQVGKHVSRLGRRLRSAGYQIWVSSAVGFTGSAEVNVVNSTGTPIFSEERIEALPKHIMNFHPQTPLSPSDQQKIVRMLEEECQANYPYVKALMEKRKEEKSS